MAIAEPCSVCGSDQIKELVGFKGQTVSHHFQMQAHDKPPRYDLALGQCQLCATVQLTKRVPISALKPRFDWIKNNEPEGHLDGLVDKLCELPGLGKDVRIGGVSFKDDSTLTRFSNRGYKNLWRVDPRADLEVADEFVGFQAIQENLDTDRAAKIAGKYGPAGLLVARHIVEHAYGFREFLDACKRLITPNGYIVFEIPDCRRAFENLDYTTIWEEHTIYFTEKTFQRSFAYHGLSLVHFESVSYSIEDSHIAVVRADPAVRPPAVPPEDLKQELDCAERFAGAFEDKKRKIQQFIRGYKRNGRKVALFGAGHMSSAFINMFSIQDLIDFVVDDNPDMKGLFMPGSGIPILPSRTIYDQAVDLCILTLSAESEKKVIANNAAFVERGGVFGSIFSGSHWAMKLPEDEPGLSRLDTALR